MDTQKYETADDIRGDFPILQRLDNNGNRIVYLDNAATTQKPQYVLDVLNNYYSRHNANVHRAAHTLAAEATELLEQARQKTATFIGAQRHEEIIFTRGTTEAINLVANILTPKITSGDLIVLTELEHHSNIVPWQMLAERTGAQIQAVKVTDNGELDLLNFANLIAQKPKILACNHVSNALGTINPIAEMIDKAQSVGAYTLIDGAQAALHETIDVQQLKCDFYAISGHKMYAPTGIGALYGRYELLESLPPWQGGGEMIEHVSFTQSTYQKPPYKFEAGTPNIAGSIGLGAAIDYLTKIPRQALVEREDELVRLAASRLRQIPGVKIVGDAKNHRAVVSFTIAGAHPNDIGTLLDQQAVAVRSGHHCTIPLMESLGLSGTVRASFSLYNNEEDVDRLVHAVEKATTFI